jgi:hypothetical protein
LLIKLAVEAEKEDARTWWKSRKVASSKAQGLLNGHHGEETDDIKADEGVNLKGAERVVEHH